MDLTLHWRGNKLRNETKPILICSKRPGKPYILFPASVMKTHVPMYQNAGVSKFYVGKQDTCRIVILGVLINEVSWIFLTDQSKTLNLLNRASLSPEMRISE